MSSKPANALLSTSDAASELRWNALLELQVAAYLPYEMSFYLTWPTWHQATTVLDAGCGNGHFLSRLRKFFPSKSYTGLDLSQELVAAASENKDLKGVEIVHGDFFAYSPKVQYDIVIMRLIVQHMAGFEQIFNQLNSLVRPGGSVIILEPDTRSFMNFPRTPNFEKLLVAYNDVMAKGRLNRAVLGNLATELNSVGGWQLRQDQTLIAPAVGPFAGKPLMQIFSLWIDLFERSPGLEFAFDDVRAELSAWAENETTFSQVGVRIVEVQRLN
jgi:SAM-dependent methyltransferase